MIQKMVPPFRPPRSLASGIRAFVGCVCCVIVALYAISIWHARAIAFDNAQRETLNLAESIAAHAADTIETSDGMAQQVIERIESDGLSAAACRRLQPILARTIGAIPRLHDLIVVDARGRDIVDNTSPTGSPDLDYRRRQAFLYHRSHPGTRVYIAIPLADSTAGGASDVEISRRLDRPDGHFNGMVVAQIALNYEQLYSEVNIGASGTVSLVRDDGATIVRRPALDPAVPHSIGASRIFHSPLTEKLAGTVIETSRFDGTRRTYSFRRLDRYPLVVIVGFAEHEFLANWATYAWSNGLVLGAVVGLIAALGVVLTVQIGHRNEAERKLAQLALSDGLTGIANRRQLDDVLARAFQIARRDGEPLALLMIDADNFKHYNDHYGHQSGDDVLRTIAKVMTQSIRPSDLAARYGGEEFAVVLPRTDLNDALTIAERIRTAVVNGSQPHDGVDAGIVTISIGIAGVRPTGECDPGVLLTAADRALYCAKRSGRNRCALADESTVADRSPLQPEPVGCGQSVGTSDS